MIVYVVSGDCPLAVFATLAGARAYAELQLHDGPAGKPGWSKRDTGPRWLYMTGQCYVHVHEVEVRE